MSDVLATNSTSKPRSGRNDAAGRLFVLELSGGRIHSMNPDGSDRKIIVTDCHLPDGIAVDVAAGHIYWTNMGVPTWLVWVFLHLMSLPQLQNRLRVQAQWFWSYFTGQRSSRLIPEPPRAGNP